MITLRNIIREVSLLRQFTAFSDNIYVAQLIDVVVASPDKVSLDDATGIFLVMEFVDNDLDKILKNQSNLDFSEEHVIIITYNLLCALFFLHSAGVMHRDIKPANVLIDDNCKVKICDFGLSRCALDFKKGGGEEKKGNDDDSNKYAKMKRLSTHISSRWYRAPEVILVLQKYNSKIDVWAVGCILAELCFMLADSQRRVMFMGGSCFPISPHQDGNGN